MGTIQHFALFEHVTGYALFRIKEFDEITRNFTAHVNAFIKPVAFIHFKSVDEAVENVARISEGDISDLLKQFLRSNVPLKNSVLGVSDEGLGKAILACEFGFECVWHSGFREILRVIRQNFTRLAKSLITQPGNAFTLSLGHQRSISKTSSEEQVPGRVAESRARLVIGLARARSQLNLTQHLADTAVVRALTLIDELDADLTRSAARLRTCYATHFPELCRPSSSASSFCLTDIQLIHMVACCPSRIDLLSDSYEGELSQIAALQPILDEIKRLARDSIGSDLSAEDASQLKLFAGRLLRMMETRNHYAEILARRVETLVPNLNALLGATLPHDAAADHAPTMKLGDRLSSSLVAARLVTNAGSLTRLANMPTSRILSLGASKALFRKSGAVAATSTGLFGTVTRGSSVFSCQLPNSDTTEGTVGKQMTAAQLKAASANRVQADTIRRKAARLLAAKSSLACRADCFRFHNPPETESNWTEDARLGAGTFGQELGHEVTHQLRVWAETNGVHPERTTEQIKAQRERRKKYRKTKRKAWLVRKLSRSAASGEVPVAATVEVKCQPGKGSTAAAAMLAPTSTMADIPESSDSEQSSLDLPAAPEPMNVDDNDSDSSKEFQPEKRRKKTRTTVAKRKTPRATTRRTSANLETGNSAKRSLRVRPKQCVNVTG